MNCWKSESDTDSFVVFLALAGGAEPLDLPGVPVDDEVVLDAVALLLAAVELSLPLGILGTLDGALHSIDDELEPLAFAQHRLEVAGLAGWEWMRALWQTLSGVESTKLTSLTSPRRVPK